MKKNILIIGGIILIALIVLVMAVDFTPQGDIDLKKVYAIKNATNITAEYFCNYTACFEISGFMVGTESDLNVNSSTYTENWTTGAGNLDSINETQMENSGGYLNILVSWLTGLFYEKADIYNKTEVYNKSEVDDNLSNYIPTSSEGDLNVNYSDDSDKLDGQDGAYYLDDTTIGNCSVDQSCSAIIYDTDEGDLNVNSTTWWATVSGFVSKWFYKSGNDLAFNETQLNLSIDARETNCTDDGSCPLITYDSELTYTTDTSAYVNCSTDEVFLGNGSCWSSSVFFDDTTIGNCSVDQSCDEVLYESDYPMANKTTPHCSNITGATSNLCTITGAGAEEDPIFSANFTNMQTDCAAGNYSYGFYGNGTQKCRSDVDTDTDTTDGNASSICSGTTTYLDGEGNCDDISGVYIDESDEGNLNVNSSLSLNTSVGYIKDVNATQMEENGGILNILVSWLGSLFYTKAEVDNNLSLYRLDSWDNFTGIPTATPSDGDTTHLSTADQIYDWVIGLAYSAFGASVDDTEMANEDFGEFTCTGNEDGCTLNTGTFDDEYIELGDSFSGEVTGVYGSTVVGNDVLDDQYYDSEGDLTTLLDDNYEPISAAHFNATAINITCLNTACNWFTNATDSCMYWPSGGRDCGA